MMNRIQQLLVGVFALGLFLCAGPASFSAEPDSTRLIVLCYHDIPKEVMLDEFAVDQESFVATIEYLRTHGFHFVSLDDVIEARKNAKALPPKPVLLTFDDAYATFYEFVYPVLAEYKIPSVLGVVSGWLDQKPSHVKQQLMTWAQVEEVAKSGLVEVVSHTHDLHQGAVYNPQGNEDAAAVARKYDAATKTYEDDENYKKRIADDVRKSKEEIEKHTGTKVRAIVWPYGKFNAVAVDAAREAGMEINLTLTDQPASLRESDVIKRFLVHKNPELKYLLSFLGIKADEPPLQRVMQLDLDMIYDEDPMQVELNLSDVLDRVKAMKVTTVYLQAFADPEGTGNVSEVYFPNKVLPMRMDLFNRVAHQLRTRSLVEVYAWMPMLSIILPDEIKTAELQVKSFENGRIVESSESYQRLSPFSQEAWDKLYELYAALASNASIDGVMFQDDGYLTDREDFHPDGLKEYLKITGDQLKDPDKLTEKERRLWTERKTDQLIALTEHLKKAVRYYRPNAFFARNLYASVLLEPESEEWFAQNYQKTLASYDFAVVMAYPYHEDVKRNFNAWFIKLVDAAKGQPQGIEKTIFKIQALDWRREQWIKTEKLNDWLAELVGAGAHHLGYYPDDFVEDHPRAAVIRKMMSVEDYPYHRD